MPELPEVEIARRTLERWLGGSEVTGAEAERTRVVRAGGRAAVGRLRGRLARADRHGKVLLVSLDSGQGFLSHLGMTGKWVRRPEPGRRAADGAAAAPRHSRARLHLDDGATLHYQDLRLFGRLRVVPGARFEALPEVRALGPDPLADGVDPARLAALLARSRQAVKPRLLDQRLLAGVGNIYASESLFRARIDPRRAARSLSRAEVERLGAAIVEAMREGIARQEGPEIAYVEEGGENPFLVYAREGERCPRCRRARIARTVQAQRSTFFCPRCQR